MKEYDLIRYWADKTGKLFEKDVICESSENTVYLQSVNPKKTEDDRVNGICLIDDNGKRVDYQFDFRFGFKSGVSLDGWCAVENKSVIALTDWDSGHGPHDISIQQLSHFLEEHGYKLVDER